MINLRRILKVVDFGNLDKTSLAECLELSRKYKADLHLLHIVLENAIPRFGGRNQTLQQVQDQMEALTISSDGVNVFRDLRQGAICDCILEHIHECEIDLVVVDKKGLGTATQKTFKAIVNQLLEQLSIPILISSIEGESESDVISRATHVLHEKFGSELSGDHQQMLQRIEEVLSQEFQYSHLDSDALIARLEALGMLTWKLNSKNHDGNNSTQGTWQIKQADTEEIDFVATKLQPRAEMPAAASLLRRAIELRATDIHIDPASDHRSVVRFRVDGRMQEFCKMDRHVAGATMTQFKIMANVSLADPFLPSESRLDLPESIKNYEVRITTVPVANGEAMALRLINCDKLYRPLNELGLSHNAFKAIYRMLHQRTGLVLISGPTGAGKTTTAYSMLNVLYTEQQNIISIEDPVELIVPFMRQINVDQHHGFTMRAGLSTVLRMDPDVVFVGEIRSNEAAHVAMLAASCGKRAFSTMHMRDVSSTISSMREFEVVPKALAENLSGVITQRLVRRLCSHCSERTPVTRHEREMFDSNAIDAPEKIGRPRGCEKCGGKGYKDRTGVFEAMVIEGDFAQAIRDERNEAELRELTQASGASLVTDGLLKVRDGLTSIQEVQEMGWLSDSLPQVEVPAEQFYERGVPYKRAVK